MAGKTKRRSSKRKRARRESRLVGAARRVAGHLAPNLADAIGIGLVVLAVLSALGLWLGAAGPLGRFLTFAVRGAFGVAGFAFPLVALWWGIVLVRGTAEADRGRMLIGLWMMLAGGLGVWSLLAGNPEPLDGYEPLAGGGGFLGALAAWPLARLISGWGAGVVCAALLLLGGLVFTATPLATVLAALRRAFQRPEVTLAERRGRGREPTPDPMEEEPEPAPLLFGGEDQEVETEAEESPPKGSPVARRSKRGGYGPPPLDLLRQAPPGPGRGGTRSR